jgi:DNA mismatch repair ATPase MutL
LHHLLCFPFISSCHHLAPLVIVEFLLSRLTSLITSCICGPSRSWGGAHQHRGVPQKTANKHTQTQAKTSNNKQNQANTSKTKQNHAKPSKTKQNHAKPSKTKQNQAKPSASKQNHAKPSKTKQNQAKPNKTKQNQATRPQRAAIYFFVPPPGWGDKKKYSCLYFLSLYRYHPLPLPNMRMIDAIGRKCAIE